MKLIFGTLLVIVPFLSFAQLAQPSVYADAEINYDKWWQYEIDSTWLGVHNDTLTFLGTSPTGREIWGYDLPRHPNGVYKYWKLPLNTIVTYKARFGGQPLTNYLKHPPSSEWELYHIWWTADTLYMKGTELYIYPKRQTYTIMEVR